MKYRQKLSRIVSQSTAAEAGFTRAEAGFTRATARVAPTIQRIGLQSPYIVGARLAPALVTLAFALKALVVALVKPASALVIVFVLVTLTIAPFMPDSGNTTNQHSIIQGASISQSKPHNSNTTPTPFMHRPYYGSQSIAARTTSFVDHDKPWYENDGIFVRYDGQKWTKATIGSCTAGVNCYDGHNGYDLNLRYEPVLSAAAGTVIRAGWYNPSNHQSSFGLWAAVDHGNGFVTAYGHMSALTVAAGDQIGTQWQIGTSGTTGSSTGPHLHMGTYYYPNWSATDPFGWTGNYPDPNVVPDSNLWVDKPGSSYPVPILSGNGSAVYPGATMVDDGQAGWSSTGTWYSDAASSYINRNLHYTSTSNGAATATATWQPKLPADGYYEVGVFVNDNHASSSWVPYTVYSADPHNPGKEISHMVYVDETHIGSFQGPFGWVNTGPQWVSLGTYYFNASMAGRVMLSNATGETGVQVSADGVEFVPVAVQSPPVYGFTMTNDGTPGAMLPNSTTKVNVTLKNTSNFTWKATGTNAVQLIYRWLSAPIAQSPGQVVAVGTPVALPRDVNPNTSVTLTVPVQTPSQANAYILQWDMTQGTKSFAQQGAQVKNDSVEVARYADVFGPTPSLPRALTPGATVQAYVSIQNIGAMTWPASGKAQVTLVYSWYDNAGHPVDASIAGPGNSGKLPADVPTGHTVSVPIIVHAPVVARNYILVADLLQEGKVFSSQSITAKALKLTVTIAPTLPKVYYFAEGYTGIGTTEYLSLTNPSVGPALVSVMYLFQNATPQLRTYLVPAQAHSVLKINQEVGSNQVVSMIVQSDQPFAAERTMYIQKGSFAAASDSVGSPELSTNWYFAEGNTTYGWNTLLAVMNPAGQAATLKITYLCKNAMHCASTSTYSIPARARGTIILNSAIPNAQFGMSISATSPVAIERPEYLVVSSHHGGSSVAGATAPHTIWYFGAGNTRSGFNEMLVLANPSASGAARVQIRYLTDNGHIVQQSVTVPAQSRIEVNVNSVVKQVIHATMISANVPIVAERQVFFTTNLNGAISGSTTTMGSTGAHASWYLAQGDTTPGHDEYLALANPNTGATQVQVVYYLSSGKPIVKTYTLAAHSRLTIHPLSDVGANRSVGIAVYATVPIVTEQVMFFNVQGASGGYASMGYGMN